MQTLELLESLKFKENKLIALTKRCILEVTGEKGQAFLQGQLSCNVTKVTENTMQPSALLNLKGRILALMDVLLFKNKYQLVLSHEEKEILKKTLKNVAILSRVILSENNTHDILGFYKSESDATPILEDIPLPNHDYEVISHHDSHCYRISEKIYFLILPKEKASELIHQFEKNNQLLTEETWHALQILNHRFEINEKTSGEFLIHRLGLQKTPTVSFDKGCYRGQEIVARTEYRATLKHAVSIFVIKTNHPPKPLDICYSEDNVNIGEIIDAAKIANETFLVSAVLPIEPPKEIILSHEKHTLAP